MSPIIPIAMVEVILLHVFCSGGDVPSTPYHTTPYRTILYHAIPYHPKGATRRLPATNGYPANSGVGLGLATG